MMGNQNTHMLYKWTYYRLGDLVSTPGSTPPPAPHHPIYIVFDNTHIL